MLDFRVDEDKCTRCGECVRDCLSGVIGMDDGVPYVREDREALCIECQHCLAVCRPGALGIFGKEPSESRPVKGAFPDPGSMETLLMGRRSVRRYKKEGLDPTFIHHMLEVVSHAPTAVNQRQTMLTVVDDPEAMDRFRERATEAALAAFREGRIPKGMERIGEYLKGCEEGIDVIFRNAPHLLVASAPESGLAPMADCHIAMSYFELLADSHGLGTVWNGIARTVITAIAPELRTLLGIPDDHLVTCVMCFGKPAVHYHRTVQRPGGTIRSAAF